MGQISAAALPDFEGNSLVFSRTRAGARVQEARAAVDGTHANKKGTRYRYYISRFEGGRRDSLALGFGFR